MNGRWFWPLTLVRTSTATIMSNNYSRAVLISPLCNTVFYLVVVYATAETSVTVDDVTHVVDTGMLKEMRYDPIANISSLQVPMELLLHIANV